MVMDTPPAALTSPSTMRVSNQTSPRDRALPLQQLGRGSPHGFRDPADRDVTPDVGEVGGADADRGGDDGERDQDRLLERTERLVAEAVDRADGRFQVTVERAGVHGVERDAAHRRQHGEDDQRDRHRPR
jgi:hypothetical protein